MDGAAKSDGDPAKSACRHNRAASYSLVGQRRFTAFAFIDGLNTPLRNVQPNDRARRFGVDLDFTIERGICSNIQCPYRCQQFVQLLTESPVL